MHVKSCALFCFFASTLFSLPQGAILRQGEVNLQRQSPQVLEIVASDKSIIEWTTFSSDGGEISHFIQPHERASVLNRVASTPTALSLALQVKSTPPISSHPLHFADEFVLLSENKHRREEH